jgi:hypothetical protein
VAKDVIQEIQYNVFYIEDKAKKTEDSSTVLPRFLPLHWEVAANSVSLFALQQNEVLSID